MVREYPPRNEPVDDYEYLIGVSNGILHIQGKKRCYGLNLELDYAPRSKSALNYQLLKYKTVPYFSKDTGFSTASNRVIGRGVVGKKYIYIPTSSGIVRCHVKSGKRVNDPDGLIKWPGNKKLTIQADLYIFEMPDWIKHPNGINEYKKPQPDKNGEVKLPSENPGDDKETKVKVGKTKKYLMLNSVSKIYIYQVE